MRPLIVRDGSGWKEIENPCYRARSPAEQRRYFEDAAA